MIDGLRRLHPRRALAALALAVLCVAGAGCEESNDGDEIVPPPIVVRSTIPDVQVNAGDDLETIEVIFSRAPVLGGVESAILPPPLAASTFRPTTGGSRQWNWLDLQLDAAAGGCHVLFDGYEFAQPFVLSFGVSPDRSAGTGLGGRLETASFASADPVQGIVFALVFDTVFNPSQPSSWADAWERGDVIAATSLIDDNPDVDEGLDYRVPYLEDGRRYYLVAIVDTDGDLAYDPVKDWWGFSRGNDGVFAGFRARPFGGDKDTPEESVNITLRAPAPVEDDELSRR